MMTTRILLDAETFANEPINQHKIDILFLRIDHQVIVCWLSQRWCMWSCVRVQHYSDDDIILIHSSSLWHSPSGCPPLLMLLEYHSTTLSSSVEEGQLSNTPNT